MRWGRRALLLGAASSLAGCGFHPVYGPLAKGGATVAPELAAIYVDVMLERAGQLLRQALEQRLQGTDAGVAKKYELSGYLNISGEAVGIQQDTSTTRLRLDGRTIWTLRQLDLKQTQVTTGSVHVVDGYDVSDQQYFGADLEQSAAFERIAESVADQITLDLALFFRKQAEAA